MLRNQRGEGCIDLEIDKFEFSEFLKLGGKSNLIPFSNQFTASQQVYLL